MAWQVQQAKQRFSELVRRALTEGPQVVTRHGDDIVVVLSAKEYQRLSGTGADFKAFLLSGPELETLELESGRGRDLPRPIEL